MSTPQETTSPPQPIELVPPNLYQLQGGPIHVTYSTTSIDGKPRFVYQDAGGTKNFTGDEIRVADTEIGQIVTVSLLKTIDTGSTTFSLVIPRANVPAGSGHVLPIQCLGITTIHRYSVVPVFNQGPTEVYSTISLNGTAQAAVF